MKKFIAIILCLALAASMCVVAFAATGTMTGIDGKVDIDFEEAEAPVIKKEVVDELGNLAHWVVDDTYYFVSADTEATHILTIKDIDYRVKEVSTLGELQYAYVATKFTNVNKDTCGSVIDATESGTFATYTDAKGTIHLVQLGSAQADGTCNVLLNGEVMGIVSSAVNYVTHEWEHIDTNKNDKVDADEIAKCGDCGVTSKIYKYNTATIKGTVFDSFTAEDGYTYYAAATYSWMTNASKSEDNKVVSAVTFDAGIALYAGMALASMAGSAVVIGKKKEF